MIREEEVFDAVRDIIVYRLVAEKEDIQMDSNLSRDLSCDSMDAIEIIMDIEMKFDIYVKETDPNFKLTVGDIVKMIEEKTCCA